MAKQRLNLTVITPDRQVLDESADSVVVPAHDGELGILPQRAPLMCELGAGTLRFTAAGQTRKFFIDGGFAQVFDNRVIVLTSNAIATSDVTPAMVAAAEREAAEPAGKTETSRENHAKAQRRASVLRRFRTNA